MPERERAASHDTGPEWGGLAPGKRRQNPVYQYVYGRAAAWDGHERAEMPDMRTVGCVVGAGSDAGWVV